MVERNTVTHPNFMGRAMAPPPERLRVWKRRISKPQRSKKGGLTPREIEDFDEPDFKATEIEKWS